MQVEKIGFIEGTTPGGNGFEANVYLCGTRYLFDIGFDDAPTTADEEHWKLVQFDAVRKLDQELEAVMFEPAGVIQ